MRGRYIAVIALVVALPLAVWLLLRALPDAAPDRPPVVVDAARPPPRPLAPPRPPPLEEDVGVDEEELPAEPPTGYFKVSGRVLDQGGDPVSGASVSFVDRWNPEPQAQTQSGPGGRFVLEQVPAGQGTVAASLAGQMALSAVDVTGDLDGVELELAATGKLEVRVENSVGQPLGERKVDVRRTGKLSARWEAHATTDAQGEARFDALPVGEYSVGSSRNNMSFANSATVKPGETASVTIRFLYDVDLAGVVLAHGQPVPNAKLTVSQGSDAGQGIPVHTFATTDEEGKFRVPVSRGRFELLVTAAEGTKRLSVDSPAEDLRITLEAASSLSGVVVEPDGQPASGYRVSVFLTENPNFFDEAAAHQETGAQGTFAFEQLARGRYRVEAARPDRSESRKASATVELGAQPTEVRLVLPAGKRLEGVVVDAAHKPLEGAQVYATAMGQSGNDRVVTDAQGNFVMPNVQADKLTVTASMNGYSSKTLQDVKAPAQGLELVLTRTGKVKGRVLLPNHTPAPLFGLGGRRFQDPTGAFELDLSTGNGQGVTLEVPDVGSSVWVLDAKSGETSDVGDLVALAGPRLKVTVLNPQGQPVPHCSVSYVTQGPDGRMMISPGHLFGGSFGTFFHMTDEQGVAELDPVATAGVKVFAAGAGGFKEVDVGPGQSSLVVRLEPPR